jgi:hypothetical protein
MPYCGNHFLIVLGANQRVSACPTGLPGAEADTANLHARAT